MRKLTLALSVLLTSSSVFAEATDAVVTTEPAAASATVVTEAAQPAATTAAPVAEAPAPAAPAPAPAATEAETTAATPEATPAAAEPASTPAPTGKLVGNAEAGKAKSAVCAACHMPDGNSLVPTFPKLAGQHASYIVDQLKLFKADVRVDPTMKPMVAPLSEQDMHDLGAYFSSQTLKLSPASDNALGRSIYHGGNVEKGLMACAACHGVKGAGNSAANYPQIQGQHGAYALKQLQAFRDGSRTGSPSTHVMQDIASKMTDSEMQAVIAYIGGLGH